MYLLLVVLCYFVTSCVCETKTNTNNSRVPEIRITGIQTNLTRLTEKFTKPERDALEKFRPLVQNLLVRDYEMSDKFLVRWLRAKNLDVKKAVAMLSAAQKWRLDNNIDSIGNEMIFDIRPRPFDSNGVDREGETVAIITPMALDFRKMALQGASDKIYRYMIQIIEEAFNKVVNASRVSGKEIGQGTGIFDFHGFNLKQHGCLACLPVFTEIFTSFEKYYPEALKYVIFINVPRIALPLLEILTGLLSPGRRKSLRVFSSDRRNWSKFLFEIIPPAQLPFRFGGTKKN